MSALATRTGIKLKAKVAIARKLLVIVYHVPSTLKPYEEPKPRARLSQSKQKATQKHLRELRELSLDIQLPPLSPSA
jgi:hypothetical protein